MKPAIKQISIGNISSKLTAASAPASSPASPSKSRYNRASSQHPCFGNGSSNNKGRIHLPVSPACNIACRFCRRCLHSATNSEQKPGLTNRVLTPAQALVVVKEAITIAPEITVAGIAGPGDTLATDAALDTFALIKEEFPQLLRCMSTNGLLLTKKLQRVREVGVDTLTVTVNEINPKRLALINDHIIYQGRIYFGLAAAQMLIRKQLEGISEATRAGIMIKVNTVLIPGINEQHIGDIARTVKQAGAGLYNVIPLIANAKMANHPTPGCDMVERARADAERHITVFRNCAHCRADAIGVPGGRDYTSEIYTGCDASGTLALSCEENTFSHG